MKKVRSISFLLILQLSFTFCGKPKMGRQTTINNLLRVIEAKKEKIRKMVLKNNQYIAVIECMQKLQEKIHDLEDHIGRTDKDNKSIYQLHYKLEKIRYQKCLRVQENDKRGICSLHEKQKKIARKVKEKRKKHNIEEKIEDLYQALDKQIDKLVALFLENKEIKEAFFELYALQQELNALVPCSPPQRVFIASWEKFFM